MNPVAKFLLGVAGSVLARKGGRLSAVLALVTATLLAGCQSQERVRRPFVGVTHVQRVETSPRPLRMHIVRIDLKAPGVRFLVTPPNGDEPRETTLETTLAFLIRHHAQVAVNAHFFKPWPATDGYTDLVGLAASQGQVYSAFERAVAPPFQVSLPALDLGADNTPSLVHQAAGDATGLATDPAVRSYNTVCGNEQILTHGVNTAGSEKFDLALHPRTAVGLAGPHTLVMFVVDGRQPGVSEGMRTGEVADLLAGRFGVTDAINLDGGGSTTLAMADPSPRVVNVPVGVKDVPGTLRPVGSNLGVFSIPAR
jgi:hypothetical protein